MFFYRCYYSTSFEKCKKFISDIRNKENAFSLFTGENFCGKMPTEAYTFLSDEFRHSILVYKELFMEAFLEYLKVE